MVVFAIRNAITGNVVASGDDLDCRDRCGVTVRAVRSSLAQVIKVLPFKLILLYQDDELYPAMQIFTEDGAFALGDSPDIPEVLELEYVEVQRSGIQCEWLPRIEREWACIARAPMAAHCDEVLVAAAVQQHTSLLNTMSVELRGQQKVAMAAVSGNGRALQLLSLEQRDDERIVRAACRQYPLALTWASARLKANRRVVRAAVLRGGSAVLACACRGLQLELSRIAHCIDDIIFGVQ